MSSDGPGAAGESGVPDEITMSASPGVIVEELGSARREVAVLTVVADVVAQARDPYPGAEVIDLVISAMLGRGFVLTTRHDPEELTAAPVLARWSAAPTPSGFRVLAEDGGVFYEGGLGAGVPEDWETILDERGLLALVLCSGVDLAGDDRTSQVVAAGRAGRAVLAQVPYAPAIIG